MSRLSAPGNVRFNFTCGLLHGMFYRAGTAFLLPMVGGLVVDLWGYDAAFAISAAVAAVGFGCSMTLTCVRTSNGIVPS